MGPLQVRQHPMHTPVRNATTAIVRVRDDIQRLGHVWVATDTRESYQSAVGRVGNDVVVADAQHFGSFGLGASVMTIPPIFVDSEHSVGNVNVTVFGEDDVG